MDALPPVNSDPVRQHGQAAVSAAQFVHSLWGLIHAGATLSQALDAIAAQRRADGDAQAVIYERLAFDVRNNGLPLFAALQAQRPYFSMSLVATFALGNLGGFLFKTFAQHLDQQTRSFNQLPPETAIEFPVITDERREFFFYLGHLLVQRAAPDEVQRWLPVVFSRAFRGDVTYILMRFYDKGLPLSETLKLSKQFQDEELIVQVEAAESLDMLGPIVLEIPDWLEQRHRLEEQLRFWDMLRQPK